MPFCKNCGIELDKDSNFCPECGTAINKNKNTERKTVYDGEIHKCPSCGENLESFMVFCPSCGYEIRGKNDSLVKELSEKINLINSIEKKKDLISNFYIPNTKEDIIEFFILATSNINKGGECIDAWWAKLEQAYQKGRLSFGDSNEFAYLDKLYKETKKQKKKQLFLSKLNHSSSMKMMICGSVGAVITLIGMFLGSASGNEDSPFYYLALLGMFPFFGSIFGAMISYGEKINKK